MHAIDRKTIAETTFGAYANVTVPHGVVPHISWRNMNLRPIDYDPERARALLADANFDMQTELMINLRDIDMAGIRLDIATIVQGYWTQVGLNAKVEAVEGAIMSERTLKGEYMLYVGGTGSVVPTTLLRFRTGSPSPTAFGYSNPWVDATIAQIDTTFDHEALRLLYDQLQEYVWEDVAVMPIFEYHSAAGKEQTLENRTDQPQQQQPHRYLVASLGCGGIVDDRRFTLAGNLELMKEFLIRRSISMIPTLLGITIIVFAFLEWAPGDAATAILGSRVQQGEVEFSQEELDRLRHELGLDRPAPVRYLEWLVGLAEGDLGTSLATRRPVSDLISLRMGPTLELMITAFLLSSVLGIGAWERSRHCESIRRRIIS